MIFRNGRWVVLAGLFLLSLHALASEYSEFLAKITPGKVQKIYSDILPGGSVEAFIDEEVPGTNFVLKLYDNKQNEVGNAKVYFGFFKNAPNIDLANISVHHSHRGRRVSARFLKNSVRFLASISNDRNTSVTLSAVTLGEVRFGAYVWAPFGFEYLAEPGLRPLDVAVRMNQRFVEWLEQSNREQLFLNPSELTRIKSVARSWRQPWQLATMKTSQIIGRTTGPYDGQLGKAFLGDARQGLITWNGILFVNRSRSQSVKQFKRHLSATLKLSCWEILE